MANILVTGGAGFIGSHLCEALVARGDRVVAIDDESTGSAANLESLSGHPRFTFQRGTLADRELTRRLVADADEVYHLAAAVGVQLIASSPIHTIEANVYLTELLLAELRRRQEAGAAVTLFLASTSEVYGKNPKAQWTEQDDLVFGPTTKARWSYGVSKAIDEFLALAYYRQHGLPVVVSRFFNVVGPRQTGRYGMVLPRLVDAALSGGPLIVHDDGKQTRCFAHVRDVVRMVLALMQSPAAVGEVFNLGSDQPVSILELAERVRRQANTAAAIEFQSYAEAFPPDFEDVRARVPSLEKLRGVLGPLPATPLDEIIREVIASKRELELFRRIHHGGSARP